MLGIPTAQLVEFRWASLAASEYERSAGIQYRSVMRLTSAAHPHHCCRSFLFSLPPLWSCVWCPLPQGQPSIPFTCPRPAHTAHEPPLPLQGPALPSTCSSPLQDSWYVQGPAPPPRGRFLGGLVGWHSGIGLLEGHHDATVFESLLSNGGPAPTDSFLNGNDHRARDSTPQTSLRLKGADLGTRRWVASE